MLSSDAVPFSISHWRREMDEKLETRKRWEQENPELAAAWNGAWAEDKEREADREKRAAEEVYRKAQPKRLEWMGVPSLIIETISGGMKGFSGFEAVEEFMKAKANSLLLLGSPGAGKTTAACYALTECVRNNHDNMTGFFIRAGQAAMLSQFGEKDLETWDKMLGVELLVLDDLGVELASDYWIARLDLLIDTRYSEQARTIITSNLDATKFKTQYGTRIADRLRQFGMVRSAGTKSLRQRHD